jgi:hypothetical protein
MVLAEAAAVLALLVKQLQVITQEQVVMVVMVLLLPLQEPPLQEGGAEEVVQLPRVQVEQVGVAIMVQELLIQVAVVVG